MQVFKYYRFWDKFGKLKGAETHVEVSKGYVIRQISILGSDVLASNRKHPQFGFYLPAGYIDYAAFNQLNEKEIQKGLIRPIAAIGEQTFNKVWQAHLANHLSDWNEIRRNHPTGSDVGGRVVAFYPQGVLLEIEEGITGLADYKESKKAFGETLITRVPMTAKVKGYDDNNQWLILADPVLGK